MMTKKNETEKERKQYLIDDGHSAEEESAASIALTKERKRESFPVDSIDFMLKKSFKKIETRFKMSQRERREHFL